jgi:hypothetical protein
MFLVFLCASRRAAPPTNPPMTTRNLLGSIALVIGLAIASLSSATAQTLNFKAFETEGISNPSDLDFIDLKGLVFSTGDGVSITITNTSAIGAGFVTSQMPTVTAIFFEDRAGVLNNSPVITSASSGVFFESNNSANLPGGKSQGFVVESAFTAVPPPPKNGLDPEDYVTFLFAGTDYDSLLVALYAGQVRVGMHIQQIGADGGDSASYISVIPEPSAAWLACLWALALFRRRR